MSHLGELVERVGGAVVALGLAVLLLGWLFFPGDRGGGR